MVLLVVDAQNGIVDERLYEFRKFVGNIKRRGKIVNKERCMLCQVYSWLKMMKI